MLEAHRHGIALARPLLRALALAVVGVACLLVPWTAAPVGGAVRLAFAVVAALLLAAAAIVVLVAVTRWERTHLVVGEDSLAVEYGVLRRRTASVALGPGTVVEVERTLLGRILGYGTVVAGGLEIDCVPRRLVRRLRQRR